MKRVISCIKEPFCGLSHLLGAALAVAGLITLLVLAGGRPLHTAAFAIYGATLFALYLASGLYHSLPEEEARLEKLKRLDHTGIYLLIAGTYTPVCLVALRGPWGYGILTAEWVLAAFGVVATLAWGKIPNVLRVVLYLVMGWMVVIAMPTLRASLPGAGVAWLTAGGLIYTFGTIIYAADRPHLWPGRFTAHDLWHVLVLAASACHFVLMAAFISAIPA